MHINDFPFEILEEIFLHVVSPLKKRPSSHKSSHCSPANPFVVCNICKGWRDIAFKSPPLWTHLHVVDPRKVDIVQHLEEWMSRAGTLPLCLSLRESWFYDQQTSIAVGTLFLNSLWRCKYFEMIVRKPLEDFRVQRFERVPSTPLESVNIWCRESTWADGASFINLLLNTPTLRTIRWMSAILGPLGVVSQSWKNLRSLSTGGGRSLSEFMDALSHCQNLESLELRERFDGVVSQFVTLPRLTHLSVLPEWSENVLTFLFVPSLVELELVLYNFEWDPVFDLMQRSGVMLKKLRIFNDGITEFKSRLNHTEVAQMLQMPYFKALRILEVEEPIGHEIIGFLTLPTTASVGDEKEEIGGYLVHLESIFLALGNIRAMEIRQSLRKLIKSRGILNPKPVSEYIEINADAIHFTLSLPPNT